jgi:hypothetical protein
MVEYVKGPLPDRWHRFKIAHNIHCKSTKSALSNRDMTSVTSAQQKKKRIHNIKNYTEYCRSLN